MGKKIFLGILFSLLLSWLIISIPVKTYAADEGVWVDEIDSSGCSEGHLYITGISYDENEDSTILDAEVFIASISTLSPLEVHHSLRGDQRSDYSVGDFLHNYYDKCNKVSVHKTLHRCTSADLFHYVATDATCTKSGNKEYYGCRIVGCYKSWKDENATELYPDDNSITLPALGHICEKTLSGDSLTYSECSRQGCSCKGGTISLNIQYDELFRAEIIGSNSFKKEVGIEVVPNQIKYYKYNDSKKEYELVAKPSDDGQYQATLTVEGLVLQKDFIIIDSKERQYLKSEVLEYSRSDEIFQTEHFILNAPGKGGTFFEGDFMSSSWWATTPAGDSLFTISTKSSSGPLIAKIDFYTQDDNSVNIYKHELIPSTSLNKVGDKIVSTGRINSQSFSLLPEKYAYGTDILLSGYYFEQIQKIVIYYYDKPSNHKHVFDKEYAIGVALIENIPCNGKSTYHRSCVCGAVDSDDNNIFIKFNKKTAYHTPYFIDESSREEAFLVKPATCTSKAEYYRECKICHQPADDIATYTYGTYLPHEKNDDQSESIRKHFVESDATCLSPAIYNYVCKNCGVRMDETFEYGSKLDHEIVIEPAQEATCEAPGKTQGEYCSLCDTVLVEQKTLPKLDHKYTAKTVNSKYLKSAATCQSPAVYYYSCKACGAKGTTTFTSGEKKNHTPKTTTTPATTTKDGLIVKTCSSCNKELSKTKINRAYILVDETAKYTGKAIKQPVTIVDVNKKAISSKYYSISYKNNTKVGKATITIKFKDRYSGKNTVNFVITKKENIPEKVSKIVLSATKAGFKATWKKGTEKTVGYEIQYSTDKNFIKSVKCVNIKGSKITSKAIGKLKSKTTYYVRMRAYGKDGKTKVYSAWSTEKSIKTK